MENYENNPMDQNEIPQEEPVQEQPEEQPQEVYRGSGAGRTEAPYTQESWSREDLYGEAFPPKKPKKEKPVKVKGSGKGWRIAVALVLAACLVGGSIAGTAAVVNDRWEEKTENMEQSFRDQLNALRDEIKSIDVTGGNSISGSPISAEGLTPSQVYNRNVKSVVAISNQATVNYFGQTSETASTGSGFILTEDGYVVTNYHVVQGATSLSVITYDGVEHPATLVGHEANNDLAVLKIEGENLPAVTIGSSDDLIVGDMVVAIGNPLGELTSTQTVGYLSAKDRDVTTDESSTSINMMQTDAAINPGNSGGPLFNMKGEVVGITTAKYSGTTPSGASIEGIGFAIPIDDVIGMVEDLMEHGYITGAYLGVSVREMDPQVAASYGLPLGVQVAEVVDGFCAQEAGIQVGDLIIGLGDYEVENYNDLSRALRKYEPGDQIKIKVYRGGQELDLNITLSAKPEPEEEEPAPTVDPEAEEQMPEGNFDEWFEFFDRYFGGGR